MTIRTQAGPARADQHEPPRGVRLRPALRGARQQGHAAGGQSPADRGRRRRTRRRVSADKPEHFFLERYRAAYAAEMAHFFDALAKRQAGAHVDRRRREGAGARRGRDDVVAREADRRPVTAETLAQSASPASAAWAAATRRTSRARAGRDARRRLQPDRRASSRGRSASSASTRCTPTTPRCSRSRTSTPCSSSRRPRCIAQQIIDALHAGKHVFCEKPLSLDLDECLRVEAEAAKHPAAQGDDRLRAPLRRELPRRARQSIAAGAIGRPFLVRSQTLDKHDPSGFFVRFAPTSRRHLPRHERARHRLRALAARDRPSRCACSATGTVAVHEGLRSVRRRRQRRRDLRVRRRPDGVLLRVAHDGARATRRRPRSSAPTAA